MGRRCWSSTLGCLENFKNLVMSAWSAEQARIDIVKVCDLELIIGNASSKKSYERIMD